MSESKFCLLLHVVFQVRLVLMQLVVRHLIGCQFAIRLFLVNIDRCRTLMICGTATDSAWNWSISLRQTCWMYYAALMDWRRQQQTSQNWTLRKLAHLLTPC